MNALAKLLQALAPKQEAYLMAGHSSYVFGKDIQVPKGVVYMPLPCGRVQLENNNKRLTHNLKTIEGVVGYINKRTQFGAGARVPNVVISTEVNNKAFHGLVQLPLHEKHNLTDKRTIRTNVPSVIQLSDLFEYFSKLHAQNPTTTYYILGNYCMSTDVLQIVNTHGIAFIRGTNEMVKTRPGETMNNALRRYKKNLQEQMNDPNWHPKPVSPRIKHSQIIAHLNRYFKEPNNRRKPVSR